MSQGKIRKIFFTVLLLSLSTMISSSYDSNLKLNAFAQTDPFANPGDNSTDFGSGPVPEDNSTSDFGSGPVPEDNSTDLTSPTDVTNPSDPLSTADVNSTDNTTPNQGSVAVPEFGSLSPIILTIAILSIVIVSTKTRLLK